MYTFQLLSEFFLLQLLRPGFLFMSQLTFNLKVNNLNFHNWNFCLAMEGLEGCTHPGRLTTSSSGALIRASGGGCRLLLSDPLFCLPLPSLQATPPTSAPCSLQITATPTPPNASCGESVSGTLGRMEKTSTGSSGHIIQFKQFPKLLPGREYLFIFPLYRECGGDLPECPRTSGG